MKTIICAALAVCSLTSAMAQENENRDDNNKIVKGPYETNRFIDNWFIGFAGGVNLYEGNNDAYGSFGKRLAPAIDVNLGKWITPSIGFRLGYNGLEAKGWGVGQTPYSKDHYENGIYNEKFGIANFHGDFMWNLSNAIGGYKETRIWNFIPYAGAGVTRTYGNDDKIHEISYTVGLYNTFRLSNRVDLSFELRQVFANGRLDKMPQNKVGIEGMSSATLGLVFKLGKTNFKRVKPVVEVTDCSQYINQVRELEAQKKDLEVNNSALQAENTELKNKKPETVTVVEGGSVKATPVALFFALGKTTFDKKEKANLEFYVENAVKLDKNKKFTIIGCADSATGSKEVNQRISEQRMQFVYDLLVNKYNISKDRLEKRVDGDSNNRFEDPELNRCVILE